MYGPAVAIARRVRCLINDFQVSPDSHAKFVITPFAPGGQEYSFAVFDWVDIGTSTDVPTWLRDGKYYSICTIKGNSKDQNMKQMYHDISTFELEITPTSCLFEIF